MGTPGAIVLLPSGAIGLKPSSGKAALVDSAGACCECCGGCGCEQCTDFCSDAPCDWELIVVGVDSSVNGTWPVYDFPDGEGCLMTFSNGTYVFASTSFQPDGTIFFDGDWGSATSSSVGTPPLDCKLIDVTVSIGSGTMRLRAVPA